LQVDLVVRLRPHVTIDAARTAMKELIDRENPFTASDARAALAIQFSGVVAQPFDEEIVGRTRPVLVALTLAVGLLLLIACVNVGSLVLVRTSGRMSEIAVRRAIGASYMDIARQFFVENTVLAVLGGIGGVACALAALRVLVYFAPPQLPHVEIIRLGGVPLAAGAATTFIAVLVFGIAPSLMAASSAPYAVLRSDARGGSEGGARRRARRWLVSSQMALALVMLAGAGLLARSLNQLETLSLGYTLAHLSLLSFSGPKSIFSSPKQIIQTADQLIARLRTLPGVTGVTPVESEPFMGTSFYLMKLAPAEQRGADADANPHVPFDVVGPDYFRTLDIPIVRGRGILESDRAYAPQVVVLSESLAKMYWPNEDPIGKKLRSVFDTTGATITVVGVARDTHFRTLRDVAPIVYVPYHQMGDGGFWNGYLMIRTQSDLSAMIPAIRRATSEVAPGLNLWQTRTMDQELDGPLAQPRLGALLLAGFSAVALILAAIGLYGVISSTVRQQTRDLGVRLALGATARDISRLVLGEAMRVVLIGAGIGVVVAVLSTRLLASLLFGVRALDPISFISASVVLIVIGGLAAFFPARRATQIDPARALRAE
jgi:predicted permease